MRERRRTLGVRGGLGTPRASNAVRERIESPLERAQRDRLQAVALVDALALLRQPLSP